MILAYRLVRLIETHSDQLASILLEKINSNPKTRACVHKVPPDELRQRVYEVYEHLGEWLLGKSEADIERRYEEIGARRQEQGVTLSELICVLVLMKDTLFEFLKDEAVPDRPVEVFGELEMLQLLDQFFDRAVYYAAVGHERARAAQAFSPVAG